jgi:hypothetical protein
MGYTAFAAACPIPCRSFCSAGWQSTRRGLGADLLRDAVLRMIAASDTIGVRAILIQAISDAAMLHLASEYPEGRSCRATGSQPLE